MLASWTGVSMPTQEQDRVDVDDAVIAAQEERHGQGREDEDVDVLGEEEEAEAHAAVLGGEAGHELGVGLGEVERACGRPRRWRR